MILQRFPDLQWLRNQSKNSFADARQEDGQKLSKKGWPDVVLNVQSRKIDRTGIIAPFSLFMNLSGESLVKSDGRDISLNADNYCLVNKGETYDLVTPGDESALTFNIHFGDATFKDVLKVSCSNSENLLDDPFEEVDNPWRVFSHSRWKTTFLQQSVDRLQHLYQNEWKEEEEYAVLCDLLFDIMHLQSEDQKALNRISSLNKSTKRELVRRLGKAVDYVHSNLTDDIDLNILCRTAELSKYHFLRTFKEFFGRSPMQYINGLKMEKAKELILKTSLTIEEISWRMNFQEAASFSKAFSRFHGDAPSRLRN